MRSSSSGIIVLILALQFYRLDSSFAKSVELPKQELSTEVVLPIFDYPEAVKNRNVTLAEKMEIALVGGASLNEPFFAPYNFGAAVTYNWSEESAVHGLFTYWPDGETSFKQQIEADNLAILTGAPRTEFLLLADYQYAPFYGKMSLTKNGVSNFHLFGLGGAGFVSIGGELKPVLSLGMGQKFYFSPSFALRFDLRGLIYQGPDPLSVVITDSENPPETSEFEDRLYINLHLTAALVFVM